MKCFGIPWTLPTDFVLRHAQQASAYVLGGFISVHPCVVLVSHGILSFWAKYQPSRSAWVRRKGPPRCIAAVKPVDDGGGVDIVGIKSNTVVDFRSHDNLHPSINNLDKSTS